MTYNGNNFFDDEDALTEFKSYRRANSKRVTKRKSITDEGEDVSGSELNQEGQDMASIMFAIQKYRFPTNEELKEFYSRETKGHRICIDGLYKPIVSNRFGDVAYNRGLAHIMMLTRELVDRGIADLSELIHAIEFEKGLTFNVRDKGNHLELRKIELN